jgi:hypothetical protein
VRWLAAHDARTACGALRVCVPLCGRSADLALLAARPRTAVLGIDAAGAALERWGAEHGGLARAGGSQALRSKRYPALRLLHADFFALPRAPLAGAFDLVWDRGGWTAVEPARRREYLEAVAGMLAPPSAADRCGGALLLEALVCNLPLAGALQTLPTVSRVAVALLWRNASAAGGDQQTSASQRPPPLPPPPPPPPPPARGARTMRTRLAAAYCGACCCGGASDSGDGAAAGASVGCGPSASAQASPAPAMRQPQSKRRPASSGAVLAPAAASASKISAPPRTSAVAAAAAAASRSAHSCASATPARCSCARSRSRRAAGGTACSPGAMRRRAQSGCAAPARLAASSAALAAAAWPAAG